MHPIIAEFGDYKIYGYGLMILLGVVFSWYYAWREFKKYDLKSDQVSTLYIIAFAAAFIGGKFFFYLEDLSFYIKNPSEMTKNLGGGFVFYGSFLFAIPSFIWYFRKLKLPVVLMFDMVAVCGALVHTFGRLGCYMAGCCYGKVCQPAWYALTFTDKHSSVPQELLNQPLYPTQLMDSSSIFFILITLLFLRRKKLFTGRIFLIYAMMYAVGRFVIEYFRGDEDRGYIIKNILSHSQLISLLIIPACVIIWIILDRQKAKADETAKG